YKMMRAAHSRLPDADRFNGNRHLSEDCIMVEMITGLPTHTVGFKLSGKLHDGDYKSFVPMIEAEVATGSKIRLLAQFHDFKGWDLHALWDDIKFSTTVCTKIERIALVGENSWERMMASVCKPFTMAKVRYFDVADLEAAKTWLREE